MRAVNPPVVLDNFWQKPWNDGLFVASALARISASLKFGAAAPPAAKTTSPTDIEFIFRPDPCVYDGRFANNGWLQELPKPVTKLTWDNAALISPKTAEKLELAHNIAWRGGEHGKADSNGLGQSCLK